MLDLQPYHGAHAAPVLASHERLTWRRPLNRTPTIRAIRHTCECRATIYELCSAGGQRFVRRTIRGLDGTTIHETDWTTAPRAVELFERILTGEAR